MNPLNPPLLAEAVTRTQWAFARLQDMNQRWHWLLLLLVCVAILAYVAYMYYRDSVELPRGVGVSLLLLRIFAFGAILFSFLDLEKKTERVLVKNSRVVLLVDTSQSMGLKDEDTPGAESATSRITQVVDAFAGKPEQQQVSLIDEFRQRHDVSIMQFDQASKPNPVAAFSRLASAEPVVSQATVDPAEETADIWQLRSVLAVCGVAVAVGCVLALLYFSVAGARYTELMSWLLLAGVLLILGSLVTAAVAHLLRSDVPLLAAVGLRDPAAEDTSEVDPSESQDPEAESDNADGDEPDESDEEAALEPGNVDWAAALQPQGSETRLGDNLADIVQRERGGPLAAIVVFTEGRNNAGIECSDATELARDAGIPLYPVGMGSDKTPVNVRVVDIEAPPRVFPEDKFPVTVYVQGSGLEGRLVKLELSSAPADPGEEGEPVFEFEEEINIRLGSGDAVEPIKFEVTPGGEEEGARYYRASVEPLDEEADPADNSKRVSVEFVKRQNRVLLMADGPTREFRFLKNMLFRDKDVVVHVCLQSAPSGIFLEADEILPEFPVTEQELFEQYDCIVACDPDWTKLDLEQARLLDRWVAEKAGGLIVIAGPVHTPEWVRFQRADERITLVKGLYPVVFDRWSLSAGQTPINDSLWAVDFTQEGKNAEFLWLDDTAIGSEGNWATFDGIYGYYRIVNIKEVKPGATIYARYADPELMVDGQGPPYMVAQFYGAGRVFFLASGEMWRLRSVEESYFETFYTKLIRHVSQGRLLRDSSRGVMMVSKQRCLLGDPIIVRAHLSDRQYEPLETSQVDAVLVSPDQSRTPLVLTPVKDAPRRGLYAGQFTVLAEGDYRVELIIPDSDGELLTRKLRARMPDLEIERPQRDDVVLKELAKQTGGEYYVGLEAARGRRGAPPLVSVIQPNDVPTLLPDTPDTDFDRTLMGWLLAAICGALCLEWIIRRMSKLA